MRQRSQEQKQLFDIKVEKLYSDFMDVITDLQNQQQIHHHMMLYNEKIENDRLRKEHGLNLKLAKDEENLKLQIKQVEHEIENKAIKNLDRDAILDVQINEEIEKSVQLVSSIEQEKNFLQQLEEEKLQLLEDLKAKGIDFYAVKEQVGGIQNENPHHQQSSQLVKRVDFSTGKKSQPELTWDSSVVNIDRYRTMNSFNPSSNIKSASKPPLNMSHSKKKSNLKSMDSEIRSLKQEKIVVQDQIQQLNEEEDLINFDERQVRFSQVQAEKNAKIQEDDIKQYMRNCNRLIRESSKIKSQAKKLEKSVDKGLKKGKDQSRMILLLREKNKRLKRKLQSEQKKYDQYEKILEDNIHLKDEILAMENQ